MGPRCHLWGVQVLHVTCETFWLAVYINSSGHDSCRAAPTIPLCHTVGQLLAYELPPRKWPNKPIVSQVTTCGYIYEHARKTCSNLNGALLLLLLMATSTWVSSTSTHVSCTSTSTSTSVPSTSTCTWKWYFKYRSSTSTSTQYYNSTVSAVDVDAPVGPVDCESD